MWWHVFWKAIEVNVWALTTIFKNTSLICGCHFCFRIQPDIDRIHLQTLSLIHIFKEQKAGATSTLLDYNFVDLFIRCVATRNHLIITKQRTKSSPLNITKEKNQTIGCEYSLLMQKVKEVIQPQVPLRLPCYDFIPVMNHTVVTVLRS